jgi:hypothetical protein
MNNVNSAFSELKKRGYLENFLVGMIATAVTAPGITIVVTVIVYIGQWPDSGPLALLLGMFGGIIGWCILAAVAQHFVTIDRANPSVYRELHSRFEVLKAQIKELSTDKTDDELSKEGVSSQVRQHALREAEAHIDRLRKELEREG